MERSPQTEAAAALLQWQIELGADEPLSERPQDRFSAADPPAAPRPAPAPSAPSIHKSPPSQPRGADDDPVRDAEAAAAAAGTLAALRDAMTAYPHCDLKLGAQNLVFSDGKPQARVMIVGEAPGRDEDRLGRPFVGRAGQLLDRMLAAIDLDRTAAEPARAVYITNVLPWRPPNNREPTAEESAQLLPFLRRHIALVDPTLLVVMGNSACQALFGQKGITRMRGNWREVEGRPCLPMFHPAYLLRNPGAKREAWSDLLDLKARLSRGED